MHVIGEWLICEDGVIRPTLAGVLRTPAGQMVEVPFFSMPAPIARSSPRTSLTC